jgi:CubicO group peptidase (beta-lactamase class C family)
MDKRPFRSPSTSTTRRVTRRDALMRTGAGIAAAATAAALPNRLLAQDASPPAASPVPDGAPGDVTAQRATLAVERLPALAQEILDRSGVPGMAVAVVHDDAVVFAGGFGVREIGTDQRVDAETVFQLASVSKCVASTVVSSLVGDGTVSWDSRMADVDPGFALHDAWPTQNVTLADLFAHRSGIADHVGDLLEDLGFGRAEVLRRLRYAEPGYSFRAGYAYTNQGLTAAAVAAAAAAGMAWEDLCREKLYAPLGMTKTSSRFADYMAQADRAIPHVRRDGAWEVTPQQRDPDPESPAGGVSSTANDLAEWVRLVLGQGMYDGSRLIPAAALAPTHIPQSVSRAPADPATQRAGFYGLGWNVSYTEFGTPLWSHSGAFALGAGTAVFLLPAAGFGIVVLANGEPVGAPEALCLSVLDLAQRGEVTRDWLDTVAPDFAALAAPTYGTGTDWSTSPAEAPPALPDDAYAGVYRNDYYGDAEVAAVGGGLVLRLGPAPLEFPLTHYDRDTFSWQPIGENAYGPSGLTFTVGPSGTATAFRDEYLATDGPGELERVAGAEP